MDIDYAPDKGKAQEEIATIMRWKRQNVRDYALLRKIASTTCFLPVAICSKVATGKKQVATFTERILCKILPLDPEQQFGLVGDLTSETIKKHRFTEPANAYQSRNEMYHLFTRMSSCWRDEPRFLRLWRVK